MIEGGPGTGKTTMAKAFIKKHKGLKGLYLCHNILLAKKIEYDLVQEDLYNCESTTYGRFLKSRFGLDLSTVNPSILKQTLIQTDVERYDYIIIDEAQDIADKGIDILLDCLTDPIGNGVETGRYLIFYDIEQGYNSNFRNIDELIINTSNNAAHFKLSENKRIITNKKFVDIANGILELNDGDEYTAFMNDLMRVETPNLSITIADSTTLSRIIKRIIKDVGDQKNTVFLVHSAFNHMSSLVDTNESIYSDLLLKPFIHEIDESEFENPDHSTVPFTTILKYKGLETHKVILLLPDKKGIVGDVSNFLFETYVGLTRAMMELKIILYKQ